MNLQQLRYVREAVRADLNLTTAAGALNTSQSGVSKQIRELEIELGIEIFIRKGKRLTGLTRAGEGALKLIERVLSESENLKRYAGDFSGEEGGRLVIATTHNQARYTLPHIVQRFAEEYPFIQLELRQETPASAARSVLVGDADLAIATEALEGADGLVSFPCFSWKHVALAPKGHALLSEANVSLKTLGKYPLITYSQSFSGRSRVDNAFAREGIDPDIRLSAMDSDIIKHYVRSGLGLGIVSEMAMGADDVTLDLAPVPNSRTLFDASITRLAVQRGALLRGYAYRFIELFAPHLKPALVREAGLARISLKTLKDSLPPDIPAFEAWRTGGAANKAANQNGVGGAHQSRSSANDVPRKTASR